MLIHAVTDIERIGDHAENLVEFSELKLQKKIDFSKEAEKELMLMANFSFKSCDYALLSFEKDDKKLAQKTMEIENKVNALDRKTHKNHYKRIEKGICLPNAGPLYLEIVKNLERISDHAKNIAGAVIMGF